MEQTVNPSELLEKINLPAFLVENGTVVCVNEAAQKKQITIGLEISPCISTGAEEYAQFTDGKLCITLTVCGALLTATVVPNGDAHLFCLEPDFQDPELRAFALAAQHLREPLANALTCANLLSEQDGASDQLSQLNRNLYQLHRAICNMSDTAEYHNQRHSKMEYRDVCGVFSEVMEKAAALLFEGNHSLEFSVPSEAVNTLIDAEKLERALLNMISNAVKFSPKDSTVRAEMHRNGQKLYFTVQNINDKNADTPASNVFSCYLREPGIEPPNKGIGLGMSIVQKTAAAHNGTLLMEKSESAGVRFTMSIAVQSVKPDKLRSNIRYPVDYAGGYDRALTELSDVLPAKLYK